MHEQLDKVITIDTKGRHCVYCTVKQKIVSRHESLREAIESAGYNYIERFEDE